MQVIAHEYAQDHPQIYNALDCAITWELDDVFADLPDSGPIYNFSRALQAPVMEMQFRGIRVDPFARDKAIRTLRADLRAVDSMLEKFAAAVWDRPWIRNPKGEPTFPNSQKQLVEFFYTRMNIPPIIKRSKGEEKMPMDRPVLEHLEQYFQAWPIVRAIISYRDISGQLEVLETEIDNDWRIRSSINIAATSTGRFSSSKSSTGSGCVLPSTEVLTPDGWKRIDSVANGQEIAQWNKKDCSICFKPATFISQDFNGKMLQCTGEQIQQTLTPNHRVGHYDSRFNYWHVKSAEETSWNSQVNIPLAGSFVGGKFELPAFAAMLMADGHRDNYGWRIQFSKQRKIDRFLKLAKEHNLDITEQVASQPECRRWRIRGVSFFPKEWGPWVLQLTPECARNLIEEARHWDSHNRNSGFIFYSANEHQAEWFATLAHLVGRACGTRLMQQNEHSWSTTPMWCVNVKTRSHAQVKRKHWKEIEYTGKVYCPTVESTFWLMRENYFISITGNSNIQNITEHLRYVFIADQGKKIGAVDKSQAEAREVGFLCGILFGDWSYLDMIESGDPHTYTARLVWKDLPWTGDIKKDRLIADQNFYRHFSYRDMSKRGSHATNYYGKAWTISQALKVPQHLIEAFQEAYFAAFPCIDLMHKWVSQQLQSKQYLTNVFGRRRDFFDRSDSDETLRGAIAYMFQSATADDLNLGMWRVWKHMGNRVQLLLQLHDAIYFQFAEDDDEEDIIKTVQEHLSIPLFYNERKFIVPTDALTGYNMMHRYKRDKDGKKLDVNPRGLDEPKFMLH